MKNILALFLTFIAFQSIAQTTSISGTVKNKQGDFLHFAFIEDKATQKGVYTDSLGSFTINISPNDMLGVNCTGYKDALISPAGKTSLDITLEDANTTTAGPAQTNSVAGTEQDIAHLTFNDQLTLGQGQGMAGGQINANVQTTMQQGGIFPVFSTKEETEGSRYFFPKWEHGFVVTKNDSIVQRPFFYFNYDKMGGGLLLSKDRSSAIEINRDLVKSFTIYNDLNIAYTFANVPAINAQHYVQVLSGGKKYMICKAIKTKFERANYSTDGVASSGNNFDSYEDTYNYYLVDESTSKAAEIQLKKKAIKALFPGQEEKVNKFMSDHSNDSVDDGFLTDFGDYMNQ